MSANSPKTPLIRTKLHQPPVAAVHELLEEILKHPPPSMHLAPAAQSPRSYAQCMLSFGYQMRGDLNGAHDVLYEALKEIETG